MSLDFKVYITRKLNHDDITNFLEERSEQYTLEGDFQEDVGNILVSKIIRSSSVPIFTIDGPFIIDTDDVEEPVIPVLLAPRWLVEISIPASTSKIDTKLAISLGKFIAKNNQGALFDPQLDQVLWPKTRPKLFHATNKAEKISIVVLKWYLPYSKRDVATARLLIRVFEKNLRECLPRKFGLFEPFQGRSENGDNENFYQLWEEAANTPYGDTLFFASTSPCFGGSITFSDPRNDIEKNKGSKNMVRISVELDSRAFQQSNWRDASTSLFISLAQLSGAFYAIGYVERGYEARSNRLWTSADNETYPLPRTTSWLGIPPVPSWLVWFGKPYAEAVRESCEKHITEQYEEGLFIRKTEQPADIDSLSSDYPIVPKELQAKLSKQTLSRQLACIYKPPGLFSRTINRLASIFMQREVLTNEMEHDKPADVILKLE